MSMTYQMKPSYLVTFFLDKKLLTSIFLTTSPVHSAEFEAILVLTSSHFVQDTELIFLMGTFAATLFNFCWQNNASTHHVLLDHL